MNIPMIKCNWCKKPYIATPKGTSLYYNKEHQMNFCDAYCSNDAHRHDYDQEKREDSNYLKTKK